MVQRCPSVVFTLVTACFAWLLFASGGDALRAKGNFRFSLVNSSMPAPKTGSSRKTVSKPPKPHLLKTVGFSIYPKFLDYHHSTFAFTPSGVYTASFELEHMNCTRLVFCKANDAIVRDYSYQMKRVTWDPNWKGAIAREICDPSSGKKPEAWNDCTHHTLNNVMGGAPFLPPNVIRENTFVFAYLVVCPNCYRNALPPSRRKKIINSGINKNLITGNFSIEMKNQGAKYPHLGFDETVYPVAPTLFLAISLALFGVIAYGIFLTTHRNLCVPFVAKVVLAAAILKIVSTGLTTAAFWKYALHGDVLVWFFVLRVPLIIADEIAIGLLMLVMSTGVGLMPASWMFDRRSSTFAVFLGLALEVFTVVTSEVFYMVKYVGMVVFIFSGGTVAFICVLYSWRNARFLAKYAKLVSLANIYVASTPLLRMSLFFHVNSAIVVTIWLFKVVSFGVMDHLLKRADLLWTLFEAADLAFLSWYAFSVFPRKKSAYYVNMSNVNNDRLRQVNDWHLRQQRRLRAAAGEDDGSLNSLNEDDSSAIVIADESGTIRTERNNNNNDDIGGEVGDDNDNNSTGRLTGSVESEDAEPAMITWNSGDPLPSPHSGMWNMQEEMRRVLKRSKPPDAAAVRVLGSPRGDLDETLALSIARPVLGPDTEKKLQANGAVIGSPFADRERRNVRNNNTRNNNNNDDNDSNSNSERHGHSASRQMSGVSDISYEAFSIPSSNASADGEVFSYALQPEDRLDSNFNNNSSLENNNTKR